MKTGLSSKLLYSTLLVGLVAPSAFAQTAEGPFFRNRHTAVTDRAQPDFDPISIRAGAFDIRSQLGVGLMFNDNVYGAASNATDDMIYTLEPSASASSNWSRHSLNAGFSLLHKEFDELEDETVTEGSAYLSGRLDVTRELQFGGNLSGGHFTEQRYQPSVPAGAAEPTRYNRVDGFANATWTRDRFRFFGEVGRIESDYDDVDRIPDPLNPGLPPTIDQDFRDVTDTQYALRGSYAVSPAVAVYVEGRLTDADYNDPGTVANPNRDSKLSRAHAGLDFELAAPFRGNIGVGYFKNDMKSNAPQREDTDGFSVNAALKWFPTQLTTVSFNADRSVYDPGLEQSASATFTNVGIRVDHELRRNILIFGGADFGDVAFDSIDRDDKTSNFSLGLGYRMNRNVRVDLSASRHQNDVSGSGVDYSVEQNIARISLRFFP